jgi:hypothetical protein
MTTDTIHVKRRKPMIFLERDDRLFNIAYNQINKKYYVRQSRNPYTHPRLQSEFTIYKHLLNKKNKYAFFRKNDRKKHTTATDSYKK